MASTVQWRLMFRVANRPAFDKCLARTLPLLGPGAEVGEGRPYWKIPELWECDVASRAPGEMAAEQVLGCLLAAQRLASGWHILGSLSGDSADGFSGVFAAGQSGSASKVLGLEWASFQVVAAASTEPVSPADVGRDPGS
jgi:hypothetical protein